MKYQWYNDEIKDSGKLYHLVVINNNDFEETIVMKTNKQLLIFRGRYFPHFKEE